ncbi:MAG: peptide chain release factor 1 [Fusobacteriota bacterium]
MEKKLDEVVDKHNDLKMKMTKPEVASDPEKIEEYGKAYKELGDIVEVYKEYKEVKKEIKGLKEEVEGEEDEDMKEMLNDEIEELESKIPEFQEDLKMMLIPKDPNDRKNVIVEIRSGAGGDEAAIFAADLYRMYTRYADMNGWKSEIMDKNESSSGLKEIVFMLKGKSVYSKLKFESGVHRVQRVPETESSGRIHTSTATVAVLPEIKNVEIDIKENDLKIDTFRASGAGGQHVNVTDSAVRITHIPTGVVVSCQDERSQTKNKDKAMKVLAAKLYEAKEQEQRNKRAKNRKLQVGSGGRSEKIRTYNFPQGRITDHRINMTVHQLESFLNGNIQEMVAELIRFDQMEKLKEIM